MKKTEYRKYIQSPHWKERRKQAIEEADNRCEKCEMPRWLAQIAYDQDLNVHHLSYANLGHEEYEDLETLCLRCHEIETFGRSDLKSPKSVKCEICGKKHWNPYSNFCATCGPIAGFEGEPTFPDFCRLINPATGQPFWEEFIADIRRVVKIDHDGHVWELWARMLLLERPTEKSNTTVEGISDEDIPF